MPKPQVTIPLDLPETKVLKSEITRAGDLIITIESTKDTAICHRCGRAIRKFHGHDDWVQIRYLPVFGHPTYLRYRPKRYRCEYCDDRPTTTQQLGWRDPNSPNTFTYERYILLQLVNSTIEDVSVKEQISYASIVGILDRQISSKVDWSQYTCIVQLGLDEIALKKGHADFVVIATSRTKDGRIRLLAVLPDREKATVVEFLRSIPQRLKKTIECGCSDMYEGYTEAIRGLIDVTRGVGMDAAALSGRLAARAITLAEQDNKPVSVVYSHLMKALVDQTRKNQQRGVASCATNVELQAYLCEDWVKGGCI